MDFDFASVGLNSGDDILPFLSTFSDPQLNQQFRANSTQFGHEIDVFDNIDSVENEDTEDSEARRAASSSGNSPPRP